MGKKTDKKLGRFFVILAICSAFITGLEGFIFYSVQTYPNPLLRWMLIVQNMIKAFTFRSDISLKDMAKTIGESKNLFELIVGYAYTVTIFTAPYCTLTMVYKAFEKFFRVWSLGWCLSRKRRIIVFGYNEEVKILLNGENKDCRIHLVADDVSKETEMELLKKKITLHRIECLKLSEKQLMYFFERMELKKAEQIILFKESSAQNFSLYQMFHKKEFEESLSETVKFICRCEDEGIRRIIESYHDKNMKKVKDLEIVSTHKLRVRKMLEEHSLHKYYESSDKDAKEWKLHLLIIGFGKLGQQILLQSMNLGVISSENEILIDVVDFNIDSKKSIFANHFSEDYVEMEENVFSIPQKVADGKFTVRFHNMDIRYKQFGELLQTCGDPKKDGIYTYVAICVENIDVSMHCWSEVEHYLKKNISKEDSGKVSIGVRMEANRYMLKYIQEESSTYNNMFVIEGAESTISLKDLLHDELTNNAKEFNYIYSMMDIKSAKGYITEKHEAEKKTKGDLVDIEKQEKEKKKKLIIEKWKSMPLFKRNSNLAIAQHSSVRKQLWKDDFYKELENCFGENGTLLQDKGNVWLYEDDKKLMERLNEEKYAKILEYAKLEHRRWCYFMASCGWKSLDSKSWVRDVETKSNSCLCNWEDLSAIVENNGDNEPKYYACKYDFMPLLMEYKKMKDKFSDKQE